MTKKVKYPGKLGQRSNDMPPKPPGTTVLGPPSAESVQKHERARREWVLRQATRSFEGIKLLLDHYEIKSPEHEYFHLAMALARDHVPYLMDSVPKRGRPKSMLTQLLPAIDEAAKKMKSVRQPQSSVYKIFADILKVQPESIKREVKRFRQQSEGEEKEN